MLVTRHGIAASVPSSGSGGGATKKCFEFGNYNRYYGYRSEAGASGVNTDDHRLKHFNPGEATDSIFFLLPLYRKIIDCLEVKSMTP